MKYNMNSHEAVTGSSHASDYHYFREVQYEKYLE